MWKPATEPPEEEKLVIVVRQWQTVRNGIRQEVDMAWVEDGFWWLDNYDDDPIEGVTHWMDIPELPDPIK